MREFFALSQSYHGIKASRMQTPSILDTSVPVPVHRSCPVNPIQFLPARMTPTSMFPTCIPPSHGPIAKPNPYTHSKTPNPIPVHAPLAIRADTPLPFLIVTARSTQSSVQTSWNTCSLPLWNPSQYHRVLLGYSATHPYSPSHFISFRLVSFRSCFVPSSQ